MSQLRSLIMWVENLVTLFGNTSGIIDAASLYRINGALQELNNVYGSTQFTGLNNEDIVLNDLTISATYDVLTTLDGYTSGIVNAGTLNTISGFLSDLLTSYQAVGITNLGNEAIILRDTGTVAATDLTTLASLNSSGTIDASSVSTITGSAIEIIAVYTDGTITEPSCLNR